jgi:hypothetical protein
MEYLKKFYDLLGTEMGNVRPLVNENTLPLPMDLPTSNPSPGKYVTPNKGHIITNFGVITVNKDLNLTVNGKVLGIGLRRKPGNNPFGSVGIDELSVLNAKENGISKITLKLKLKTPSSERKQEEITLDLPEDNIKNVLTGGKNIAVTSGDETFYVGLNRNK